MIFKRQEKINTNNEHLIIKEVMGSTLFSLLAANNAFLAGGAITSLFTNQKINDWDIFFPTKESFDVITTAFKRKSIGFSNVVSIHETQKALTFQLPSDINQRKFHESYGKTFAVGDDFLVQLCQQHFLPIKEAIQQFDWTCVMGAYDFKTQEFYFHPNFFPDIARKRLVLNENCQNPLSAYFRKNKYQDRGYTIDFSEELKLVMKINNLKIDTWQDFLDEIAYLPNYGVFERIRGHLKKNKSYAYNVDFSGKPIPPVFDSPFTLDELIYFIETNPYSNYEGKVKEHQNKIHETIDDNGF